MADTTFGPKGWTPERLGSLAGKTYLITGANAGTGREAARLLDQVGHQHDGHLLAQALEHLLDPHRGDRVDRNGKLIQ